MHPYLRVEHQLLRDGAAFSSVHEKMVYLLLKSYAGRDGLAFPSHQTLADAVPCGKTTVKNCLQTLVEKGWIEKVERFDRHGGQTSNGYRIRMVSPVTSGQDPGQETATGQPSVASEEKGVKKPSLKKNHHLPESWKSSLILRRKSVVSHRRFAGNWRRC
ncbi:helix-turn-helix domain-containing protein [Exiguobacterium artemiae]